MDLASIDTSTAEADSEVAGKPWFNARPSRPHVSCRPVKSLGANRYEVAGTLTIKGKTHNVVVPATFTPQGNTGVFDGSLTIRRGDFRSAKGRGPPSTSSPTTSRSSSRIAASGK